MIRAVRIELNRAEGFVRECGSALAIEGENVWRRADDVLRRWSNSAPKDRGYHKCDFKITFADGETYEGRYDLVHWSCEFPYLARHVRDFCEFYSLRSRPSHFTKEEWDGFTKQEHLQKLAPEFARVLDGYAIGDPSSEPEPAAPEG